MVEYSLFVLQDLFTFFSTLLEIFDWGTDINNIIIYGADCMNCNSIGANLSSKSILDKLFSNRVKPGTMLIEIVLTGNPLYYVYDHNLKYITLFLPKQLNLFNGQKKMNKSIISPKILITTLKQIIIAISKVGYRERAFRCHLFLDILTIRP